MMAQSFLLAITSFTPEYDGLIIAKSIDNASKMAYKWLDKLTNLLSNLKRVGIIARRGEFWILVM